MPNLYRLPFRIALLSSALVAAMGQAQEKEPKQEGVFYEVISVTAQKRTQGLQDVGVSVSAFSEEQIDALGWENSLDVAAQTPGLVATSNTGDSSNIALFSIRGVSQLDFAEGQEAPIAIYQDEAYLSSPGASGTPAFDLERIEVLRGPQGTLYGRNATGGLVHFISNKPTDDFRANAELTIAEFGQVGFNGAVSGALGDNVQGRVAVYSNKDDGYVKNVAGPDKRADDTQSIRAMLNIDFSDDSSLLLTARYTTIDTRGGVFHTVASRVDENGLGVFCQPGETNCGTGPSDPNSPTFSFFDVAGGQVDDGIGDELEGFFDRPGSGVDRDTSSLTATFTTVLDSGIEITSVTDISQSDKAYSEDDDSVEGNLVTYDSTADIQQFSQELRVNGSWGEGHNWIAGFYYLNIDNDFSGAFQFPLQFSYFPRFDAESETQTYSVFGQLDYQLASDLLLTAGLRWTQDDKDIRYEMTQCDVTSPRGLGFCPARLITDPVLAADPFSANEGFAGLLVDGLPHDFDRKDEEFSGKLQLDWTVSDDTLLYAGVSRGVKGGGFNTPSDGFETATIEAVGFEPEILWAYEAGIKSSWLNNKLRVNAGTFYYDYDNYQAFFFADTTSLLINSEAEFFGGELEVTYSADSWDFLFGISLLDTEVNGQAGATVIADQKAPLAPDTSVNGLVRKFWELDNGGTLVAQLSANYVGEQYFNVVNSETTQGGDYTLVDARLSYTTADDYWEFSLFAKNLTDERPVNYSYDISGFGNYTILTIGAPSWYGLNVKYRY